MKKLFIVIFAVLFSVEAGAIAQQLGGMLGNLGGGGGAAAADNNPCNDIARAAGVQCMTPRAGANQAEINFVANFNAATNNFVTAVATGAVQDAADAARQGRVDNILARDVAHDSGTAQVTESAQVAESARATEHALDGGTAPATEQASRGQVAFGHESASAATTPFVSDRDADICVESGGRIVDGRCRCPFGYNDINFRCMRIEDGPAPLSLNVPTTASATEQASRGQVAFGHESASAATTPDAAIPQTPPPPAQPVQAATAQPVTAPQITTLAQAEALVNAAPIEQLRRMLAAAEERAQSPECIRVRDHMIVGGRRHPDDAIKRNCDAAVRNAQTYRRRIQELESQENARI